MYTYRRTGTASNALGSTVPLYTAYTNGTPVATVHRWVPGKGWAAATAPGVLGGGGSTRNAAVTAALAATAAAASAAPGPGPGCANCMWVGTCASNGGCKPTAPCPTCATPASACAVCGWCNMCGMCAGCHAGNPMCATCNSTQCGGCTPPPAYTMPATYAAWLVAGALTRYGYPVPCAACGTAYVATATSGRVCPACTTTTPPTAQAAKRVYRAAYGTAQAAAAGASYPLAARQYAAAVARSYYQATGNQAAALAYAQAMLARYLAPAARPCPTPAMVRTTGGAFVPAPACGHTGPAARTPNGACGICTTATMATARATHPTGCTCGYCPFVPGQALAAALARMAK